MTRMHLLVLVVALVSPATALLRLKGHATRASDCETPVVSAPAPAMAAATASFGPSCTTSMRRNLVMLLDKVLGACEISSAIRECREPTKCSKLLGVDGKYLLSNDLRQDVSNSCPDSLTPACAGVRTQVSTMHSSFQQCTGCTDAKTCSPATAVAAKCGLAGQQATSVVAGVGTAFSSAFKICVPANTYVPKCKGTSLELGDSFRSTVKLLASHSTAEERSSFPLKDLLSLARPKSAREGRGDWEQEEEGEDGEDGEDQDDEDEEDEDDDDQHSHESAPMLEEGDFEEEQ